MNKRAFKDQLYAEFARIAKAMANPHRLELLDLLAQGERSVEELAQEAGLSLANASAHLQILRRAHLVETEKRGLNVIYCLAAPEVYALWRTLRDLGTAQLAEIDRLVSAFFREREQFEAIGKEELRSRLAAGDVVVLDVRPVLEYAQGHLPGAVSIPIQMLEQRLSDLPRDREIVAYCRGPYCVYADEAVHLLHEHG
ncbi:MAG TPA: metalloregulator ArsR/SmtB family transcription factor, partial [Nitrolancea sp.]|nr:metalloregulator ArsR/SmtB family transcription factor [Nitrolancea sp.]